MPLVKPPKECAGCGACCCRLIVTLAHGEEVPDDDLIEKGEDGYWQMKQREDESCIALDRNTMLCTIYDDRPKVCREFGPDDNRACLDSVFRRQQIVMNDNSTRVEELLKAAVDFAMSRGLVPTILPSFKEGDTKVAIYLQPTLTAPDVRVETLDESLCRMRDALAVSELVGEGDDA